jgi:hypothetical protein
VRRAAPAILAVLAALLLTAASAAADPVRFAAAFGPGARLGASTSMSVTLAVPDSLPPVTEVRLLTPAGIDLGASGLGVATCDRPQTEIDDVMHFAVKAPCPGNALMATGAVTAQLRFDPLEIHSATAQLQVFAGPTFADKPGLVIIADAFHPVRTQLTYRGYLYVPPPEFGVGLVIKVATIPRPPFGIPVALSSFGLTVGGSSLRYARTVHGRRTFYQPHAIPLPDTCPAAGFRFRAIVRFQNGQREVADARVACPPRKAA